MMSGKVTGNREGGRGDEGGSERRREGGTGKWRKSAEPGAGGLGFRV